MNYKKIKYLKKYYEESLRIHKSGPKAVNWKNKKTQYLRFEKICEIGNFNNKKILDVGCGLGHLVNYLELKKLKFHYQGVDISAKMIDAAKLKIKKKNVKFFCKDILAISKNDIKNFKSDYVINCGLFTVKNNLKSKEWWKYIQKMMENMFVLSKKGISFNLMKPNVDFRDKHLHYQSTDQLIDFIEKNLSKKIIIKNDYDLWEYTCHIYK